MGLLSSNSTGVVVPHLTKLCDIISTSTCEGRILPASQMWLGEALFVNTVLSA